MSDATVLEPPAAQAAPAAPTGPLADLILVRLLPATKSVGLKALRKDLADFFREPPSSEQVTDMIAALRAAGLVTPKGQQLTAAGRTHALGYLGVKGLPPQMNWSAVKVKFLVPKALGFPPDSDEAKATTDAKKLAALLIKRKYGLPEETPLTLTGVLDALAYRELQLPAPRKPKPHDIRAAIISKALRIESPLTGKQLADDGARLLLGSQKRGADGLRALILGAFADRETGDTVQNGPDEFDLEMFANTVKTAARHCPTGRFGDNKVFISHVWTQLKDEPRFTPLGLDGFKAKLVEANRLDLLTLSRVDLYQDQNPADIEASETIYGNAVFHFILADKE